MQTLWQMAISPIAEVWADPNSYGFRPKRSVAAAIEQTFIALSRRHSTQWIFEGDIKAFFDRLSQDWIVDNIPMNKCILTFRIHSNKKAGIKPKLVPSIIFKDPLIWSQVEKKIKIELLKMKKPHVSALNRQLDFWEEAFDGSI